MATGQNFLHNFLTFAYNGFLELKKISAEQELVEFLTEEILAERKAQKVKTIPSELDGFKASLNGAEVTLTKKTDEETLVGKKNC